MAIKEIKKLAKESLNASLGKSVLATLLFMVFIGVIALINSRIVDFNEDIGKYVAGVIGVVAYFFIYLGFISFFLKVSRGEDVKVTELFKPREHFIKYFGLELVVMVLAFICTFIMLYIIMNLFIGNLNNATEFQSNIATKIYVVSLLGYIPGVIIGVFFSQIPFAFLDNADLSFGTIIEESLRIMKGNKIKLVLLALSFIGWFLLVLVLSALVGNIPGVRAVVGILSLAFIVFYILPYIMLSLAYFYNDISDHNKQDLKEKETVTEE